MNNMLSIYIHYTILPSHISFSMIINNVPNDNRPILLLCINRANSPSTTARPRQIDRKLSLQIPRKSMLI